MNVLNRIRALPIRQKLTLLLLAPCVVVLLLAGAVLVWFQLATFRHTFERDLISAGEIVANTATAAIAFDDESAATESLRALRAKEHIVAAVLITPDRRVFARYGKSSGDPDLVETVSQPRAVFRGNNLLVSMPVLLDGKQIATLQVLSDYRQVYRGVIYVVGCMLALVIVVAVGVAALLSNRLQRFVSEPVVRLTETARQIADRADFSVRAHEEEGDEFGVLTRAFNQMLNRIQSQDSELQKASQELARQVEELQHEIAERKKAERKLEELHKELMTASRHAGRAEVATSVLHNVGNVLNSVNISASLIAELTRNGSVAGVGKVAALLGEQAVDLAGFLSHENRGAHLIAYLKSLSNQLASEKATVLSELEELTKNIEHVKEIVAMQQSYARVCGVVEVHSVPALVEDALRMHLAALARHKVEVVRQFETVPDILVDKHKVLQILVNLISNAKYALSDSSAARRLLKVSVAKAEEKLLISVADNGVGIAPENLTRVFVHGFTTKHDGHGFGLHSGALAAREMGGELVAKSDGLGKGAVFSLELPLKVAQPAVTRQN